MSIATRPRRTAGPTAPARGALDRLLTAVRARRVRCTDRFYAPFLRRRVRCRLEAGHPDRHRFVFLDETVTWR